MSLIVALAGSRPGASRAAWDDEQFAVDVAGRGVHEVGDGLLRPDLGEVRGSLLSERLGFLRRGAVGSAGEAGREQAGQDKAGTSVTTVHGWPPVLPGALWGRRVTVGLIADGASNGTRTRDIQDHNLALYQLSYARHPGGRVLALPAAFVNARSAGWGGGCASVPRGAGKSSITARGIMICPTIRRQLSR